MAPFAVGTWSVVGNTGRAVPGSKSPFNVAYSTQDDVLCAGDNSQGPVFSLFNPGRINRSVDGGATWAQVYAPTEAENGSEIPPFSGPMSVGWLRDTGTGLSRFAACIVRVGYTGATAISVRISIASSETGLIWALTQTLIDLPDLGGFPPIGFAVTSFATRPPSGGPAEHYIVVEGTRGVTTVRGLYRSTDLGLTWTLVGDPGVSGGQLLGLSDRALTLGGLRSEDGGVSWVPSVPLVVPFTMAETAGTVVGVTAPTLTTGPLTRISCDGVRTWPPGQDGPVLGLTGSNGGGAVVVIQGGSAWEVFLAAPALPLGIMTIVYSDTGGETESERALFDSGSGIITYLSGGAVLADGRPLFVNGITGQVIRSSDVVTNEFGTRIYCVVAPAPGVGVLGFPEPCGDFYNPCPQECPTDPAAIERLVVAIPVPVVLGDSWPFGDEELTYGDDEAIYGGDPNTILAIPVLGLPAGCGHTFVNEPCAAMACPA